MTTLEDIFINTHKELIANGWEIDEGSSNKFWALYFDTKYPEQKYRLYISRNMPPKETEDDIFSDVTYRASIAENILDIKILPRYEVFGKIFDLHELSVKLGISSNKILKHKQNDI